MSDDVLIMDSGGGKLGTVTKRAWWIESYTSERTSLSGYQDKSRPRIHPVVNAITKTHVKGREQPVLLLYNHVTLLDDPEEKESLCVPFSLMVHGIKVDLTPEKYGGRGSIVVDGEELPLDFDGEKLYYRIEKPTKHDLDELEIFEISMPKVNDSIRTRRNRKRLLPEDIPIEEWRKRLCMAPEDVVRKTLQNTTQFYLSVGEEDRMNPRRHFKSRTPGIRLPRQNEMVSSDTFFPSITSDRGNSCSQIFVGNVSNRWEVFPMKTESHNGVALQDYTRKAGAPPVIKTDNAKSETGETWTEHCRRHCINQESTEPHTPWQNPAEHRIGDLGGMVRRCMREFKIPMRKHDWVQKWCCDVHNVLSNRGLKWTTPMEVSLGYTPDISVFRYHVWEPIWYFDPDVKQPLDNLKKARWLGIAWSAGDQMTYFIETERPKSEGKPVVLTRSVIKTRRKKIGHTDEHIEEDPEQADFVLDPNLDDIRESGETKEVSSRGEDSIPDLNEMKDRIGREISLEEYQQLSTTGLDIMEEGLTNEDKDKVPEETVDKTKYNIDTVDEEDHLDKTMEEMEDLYNQVDMEDDDDYNFERIVDHYFEKGSLHIKANYTTSDESIKTLDIPFSVLKRDIPYELAKYIREKVVETKRGGRYTTWARKMILNYNRSIKRLYKQYRISRITKVNPRKVHNRKHRARISRNARNAKIMLREKFGIKLPRNTREALQLDIENGNKNWAEAITKEISALDRLHCFKYHSPGKTFSKQLGWQFAPVHMIYDIKQQDLRHKARLVVGGHVIDSTKHIVYSSNVHNISVRLLLLLAMKNNLNIMTGDIGNAFPTAPCIEKIWSVAGVEFGERNGSVIEIQRALYGMATASRAFHEFLGDKLRRMDFIPSRADPDLWMKINDEKNGYDYIATHVDDLIIVAKEPQHYMSMIEQEFVVRNIEDSPSYYLGNNLKKVLNKYLHISSSKYITEVIRRYQLTHGTIKKENTPMNTGLHPEMDTSDLLDEKGIKHFQKIIGICQWLVVSGRFDINYAICSLSRFQVAPREEHLNMAQRVLGYLKKYPKRGFVINDKPPTFEEGSAVRVTLNQDFGAQYQYFREDMDPRFPIGMLDEMEINIFIDSDHGHDKLTGRSVTGMIAFIGSTPIMWLSKRQSAVQTSTFGAEFTALKTAVESAVTIRYYLRSMGIKVSKPTTILADNLASIINATNPASTLNKKHVALAYHFVREHVANNVVEVLKIRSEDNYADPFTKGMNSTAHGDFFHNVQQN